MQPAPSPGHVLGDRYTLKKTEWRTPLGPVWLARDRVLDRPVFVQMLDDEIAGDADVRKTFLRSAARNAQVTNPGLLQVYDIGTDPAFVVLEHAAGGRLTDRLRAGPLRATDAVRAALGLARGLEALHERGAWHGSLSPDTVLFDDEGRAKILAVGAMETAREVTGIDATHGQPDGYRPDDLDSLPSDDDRFALAALTYHMLTGKQPSKLPLPARQVRRDVPADVDALLRRALDEQPTNRPSLDEFVSALAPHARVVPVEADTPRFSGSEFRWLVPVVLILVLGALAATFGVRFVQDLGRDDPEPDASPTTTAPAEGEPLSIASVSDFDPDGNGEERSDQVARATDGQALTSWRTVDYASRDLDKAGVGLLFDLGETRSLARVRMQSTLTGWEAEIRVADEEASTADGYRTVATFTAGVEEDVALPRGTQARYVLLWITELAEHGGGSNYPYRAEVAEVELFAA